MKQNPLGPLHPQRPSAPTPISSPPAAAVPAPGPAPQHILGDPFDRDRFLLKQRLLTISEKYDVSDEAGNRILFVKRPAMFLRNILALVGAIATFIALMVAFLMVGSALSTRKDDTALAIALILGLVLATCGSVLVAVLVSPRRHVTMFRDEGMTEQLLHVRQEQKVALMNMRYTVTDAAGAPLAVLRKNYLYDMLRKKWICETPAGAVLCIIREDSLIKAVFRRFVGGVFAAMLRTNFIITDESEQNQIGKFDRKFTILDRYVLDMSADPARRIDRRVAVAIGVMLDTGERR
jgi:uncharacterized protein YxjI